MRRLAFAVLALLTLASAAHAHMTPNSVISLDFRSRAIDAEILIPMGELAYAMGAPLDAAHATSPAVQDYILAHISVQSVDGRAWSVALRDVSVERDGGGADIRATLTLTPPERASLRQFNLHWNGVIDHVANHYVLVFARSDFLAGTLANSPELIGGLQGGTHSLSINRQGASLGRGVAAALRLGMAHIVEGHDHLLFLIVLLLPAPLLVQARRWDGYAGLRTMFVRLALIVSAFTVGHSITLIGGAFFGWKLPARPIEVAIALTILVSAIHAWRPIFGDREPWLAAGFGLIHGLAFATVIGNFHLEVLQKALAIFGFNLGIEIAQLAVIVSMIPLMLLLAPTREYAALRLGGAVFAGVAALAWAVARVTGAPNIVSDAVEVVLDKAPWLIMAATLAAVSSRLLARAPTPAKAPRP